MPNPNQILEPLDNWIETCKTNGKVHRNTVAIGIVVLDHLIQKCPVERDDVCSKRGEIKGSRQPGLAKILTKYGIPAESYLQEVTTRQGHQDGQRLFESFEWGGVLVPIPKSRRNLQLREAIQTLVQHATEWLARQNLKIECDNQSSPATWISNILKEAKGRSNGAVEQHLIGAKLERRHPDESIPNNSAHAGDRQTKRPGDFILGTTAYHITVAPSSAVIDKCRANIRAGLHPLLLVPSAELGKARHLAEDKGIESRVTIIAIEDS